MARDDRILSPLGKCVTIMVWVILDLKTPSVSGTDRMRPLVRASTFFIYLKLNE